MEENEGHSGHLSALPEESRLNGKEDIYKENVI